MSAAGASEVDALFAVGAADATHEDGLWDLVCGPLRAVAASAEAAPDSAASLALATPRDRATPRSTASGPETPRFPAAGSAHSALRQRRSKVRALQQVPAALSQSTARIHSLWAGPVMAEVGGGGGTRAWRVARAHARSAAIMLLRGVLPTARPGSDGTGPVQAAADPGKMLWPRGNRFCPADRCVACAAVPVARHSSPPALASSGHREDAEGGTTYPGVTLMQCVGGTLERAAGEEAQECGDAAAAVSLAPPLRARLGEHDPHPLADAVDSAPHAEPGLASGRGHGSSSRLSLAGQAIRGGQSHSGPGAGSTPLPRDVAQWLSSQPQWWRDGLGADAEATGPTEWAAVRAAFAPPAGGDAPARGRSAPVALSPTIAGFVALDGTVVPGSDGSGEGAVHLLPWDGRNEGPASEAVVAEAGRILARVRRAVAGCRVALGPASAWTAAGSPMGARRGGSLGHTHLTPRATAAAEALRTLQKHSLEGSGSTRREGGADSWLAMGRTVPLAETAERGKAPSGGWRGSCALDEASVDGAVATLRACARGLEHPWVARARRQVAVGNEGGPSRPPLDEPRDQMEASALAAAASDAATASTLSLARGVEAVMMARFRPPAPPSTRGRDTEASEDDDDDEAEAKDAEPDLVRSREWRAARGWDASAWAADDTVEKDAEEARESVQRMHLHPAVRTVASRAPALATAAALPTVGLAVLRCAAHLNDVVRSVCASLEAAEAALAAGRAVATPAVAAVVNAVLRGEVPCSWPGAPGAQHAAEGHRKVPLVRWVVLLHRQSGYLRELCCQAASAQPERPLPRQRPRPMPLGLLPLPVACLRALLHTAASLWRLPAGDVALALVNVGGAAGTCPHMGALHAMSAAWCRGAAATLQRMDRGTAQRGEATPGTAWQSGQEWAACARVRAPMAAGLRATGFGLRGATPGRAPRPSLAAAAAGVATAEGHAYTRGPGPGARAGSGPSGQRKSLFAAAVTARAAAAAAPGMGADPASAAGNDAVGKRGEEAEADSHVVVADCVGQSARGGGVAALRADWALVPVPLRPALARLPLSPTVATLRGGGGGGAVGEHGHADATRTVGRRGCPISLLMQERAELYAVVQGIWASGEGLPVLLPPLVTTIAELGARGSTDRSDAGGRMAAAQGTLSALAAELELVPIPHPSP